MEEQRDKINVLRGAIGTLQEYRMGTDWSNYQERMEQYFMANYVEEDRKVAVLLTVIGDKAYEILKGLCDPVLPKDVRYEALCTRLRDQFTKKISVFKERIEFYNFRQLENESVKDFFVRLKNKAIDCKFGANLNAILKDRIISGLRRGPILNRLCEEDHTIQLEQLYEIALKKEAAIGQSSTGYLSEVALEVNKVSTMRRKNLPPRSDMKIIQGKHVYASNGKTQEVMKCNSCGEGRHNFKNCKYKGYKCKICGKVGHLAKVCTNRSDATNFVEPLVDSSNESNKIEQNFDFMDMFFMSSNKMFIKPVQLEMTINDKMMKMELDSGAGISVIPESIYNLNFKSCKLEPTNIRLRTFDGNIIVPTGEIYVDIKYKDTVANACRLVVIKNGSTSLIGRDLMETFNFKIEPSIISNIHTVREDSELTELLKSYHSLFDKELGQYKYEKVELKLLPNSKPIFCKPRPIPFSFKKAVNEELDELEQKGVLTLVENSEWATPLVPVVKETGKIRLCADYKVTVNKYIEDVKHPLPRIEEIFAALQGGECYTKLDFTNAYNQLELTDATKKLLCWSTHRGIYQLNRLPYGTKPACSIFQKVVEKVLLGISGAINFLDDIVVTGKDKAEHLKNLELVFERLSRAGFKLNIKKCSFFKSEIRYLGHIISKNGLRKDPEKVSAIMKCDRPNNVSEVKAYVGMVNYYGRFIPRLSTLLTPLYQLLRKGVSFKWSTGCEKAFMDSKNVICSDICLAHYDPKVPLKLVCDASNSGIGAVLLHIYSDGTERPISFVSRVLNKSEMKYSVIHKEALALYWGVRKFYQYLMGNHFILCSDHKPLAALMGESKGIPQMAAGRLQRWALFLSGFNYTFKYVKGTENGGADGLSRIPLKVETSDSEIEYDYFHFLVEENVPISATEIRRAIRSDVTLSTVFRYVRDGWPDSVLNELKPYQYRSHELSIDNDLLMWGYRVVIPPKFREQLLRELHWAHNGIVRMKSLARQFFWWPGLDGQIEKFVKNCDACMRNSTSPPRAALMKFQEGRHVFDRIHIDFLGPYYGKIYLIITDSYSKWPEDYEMQKADTLNTISKLRDCFARFGLPNTIISDNGPQFISREFKEFCKHNGIQHITSAPYHPSTNGAAENSVKSLKYALNKMLSERHNTIKDLSTLINKYLFSYRNTPHSVTNQTPSKLMFSRKIKTRFDFLTSPETLKARERQIEFHKGNRMIAFNEGEVVYTRDYRGGPKASWVKCKIIQRLGQQTYLCKLLEDTEVVWKRHLDQILKIGEFYSSIPKDTFNNNNKDDFLAFPKSSSMQSSEYSGVKPKSTIESDIVKSVIEDSEVSVTGRNETPNNTETESNNISEDPGLSGESSSKSLDFKLISPNVKNRPRRIIKPPERLNL